jgi:hypothetical protein
MSRRLLLLLLLATIPLASFAILGCSRSFTEVHRNTFGVRNGVDLSVEIFNGNIDIVATSDVSTLGISAVNVRSTLRNATRIKYRVFQRGDTVSIEATASDRIIADLKSGVDVEVEVPEKASLTLSTTNGKVVVNGSDLGIEGSISVSVNDGEIVLVNTMGQVNIQARRTAIFYDGEFPNRTKNHFVTTEAPIYISSDNLQDVSIDADPDGGQVRIDVPLVPSANQFNDRVKFSLGDGTTLLRLRSSNAEIAIIPGSLIPFP